MRDETLREYRVVELPQTLGSQQTPSDDLEKIVSSVGNESIELLGNAPNFFVLPLFARLRDVADEIIYRSGAGLRAVLVMSIDHSGIRPNDIIDTSSWWGEEDLKSFEVSRESSMKDELDLRLDVWWNESLMQKDEPPLRYFLRKLYKTSSPTSTLRMSGDAPTLPSLFAANWFLSGATRRVEYQGIILKNRLVAEHDVLQA